MPTLTPCPLQGLVSGLLGTTGIGQHSPRFKGVLSECAHTLPGFCRS